MKENTKKVFLKSFGCQMNVRDSEVIAGLLKTDNWQLTTEADDADVIIFNTCSVRQHAEDKVWSEIGRIAKQSSVHSRQSTAKNKKKQSTVDRGLWTSKPIIGVVGCMAQNYKESIFERSPAVDFVVGPSDIAKIPQIIKELVHGPCLAGRQAQSTVHGHNLFERKIWETDSAFRPEEIYHTGFYEDKEHSFVVISEGCSNYCSYCVVPYVRGELHNRNYEDILNEIQEAVAKGISKVTLLGQNVNAYQGTGDRGQGTGEKQIDFTQLLVMVNEIKGLKEFNFVTSHPRDTGEELFKAMQECEKLKKYLHLPVQSGSDRILKLMNRSYTRDFYLDLIEKYRKIVKTGALSTDIILGFPTESEKDFQDTFDLVKTAQFNAAYIFKYSVRPNTEAARFMDDVLKEEKERRHALVLELQKGISKSKKSNDK